VAKRVEVSFVSDLSGRAGDDVGTVEFSLDGAAFEIDLTGAEAEKLRKVLEPYCEAGRRKARVARSGSRSVRVGPDPKTVRAWAGSHGIQVPQRGRIPADVIEQFEAAEGA